MDLNLMVFIGSLMNIFVLDRQVRVFFDKRRTAFPVFALSFLFYVVLINVSSMLPGPRLSLLIWFASYIVLSLNYNATWKKRIVAAIALLAIGAMIDLGVMLLFGIYFDSFFGGHIVHNALTMTVSSLTTFIAALALQKFTHLKKDVISSPGILAFLFFIPLSSIALALFLAVNTDLPPLGAVFTSAIIFGINVIVFYLHDRLAAAHEARLETALAAREKDYYLAQCRLMQESIEKMRSLRHDMLTHMTAVKGYAAEVNAHKITAYLEGLLEGGGEAEVYSDTGNIIIDSIINYKMRNARNENIILDIRLKAPPEMNIEQSDLATILGNLLDNAMEAVAKAEEKKLHLDIEYSRKTLFIKVKNTFDGKVTYTQNGEKRISTSKAGGGHGQGLKNIERAIEKYNGQMDIAHDNETFTAQVFLYEVSNAE